MTYKTHSTKASHLNHGVAQVTTRCGKILPADYTALSDSPSCKVCIERLEVRDLKISYNQATKEAAYNETEATNAVIRALQVILKTGHIKGWLAVNDPQALKQAEDAIDLIMNGPKSDLNG